MILKDFFFHCMNKKMYMNREWILRAFAIIPRDNLSKTPFIPSFQDKKCFFTDEEGQVTEIEDFTHMKPLFHLTEAVPVSPDEFPHFKEKTISSFGNMIVGLCIFEWALGGKLPMPNKKEPLSIKYLDGLVSAGIEEKILNIKDDYKSYIKAMDFLSVFTDFITPVGSKTMFLPDKETLKLRDKLLKEFEGKLDEPEVAAYIEGELSKSDKAYLEGDKSQGFLSDKLINTVRKKMNYVGGVNDNLKDPSKVAFIKSSLVEGWDAEDIPAMVNSLRSGSYSRGAMTAVGGVFTKLLQRAFQNAKIGSEDCGTNIGLPLMLEKHDIDEYMGRYDAKTGKLLNLTPGTFVYMRDPATCQEPDGNVCQKCLGDRVGKSKASLGSLTITFSGGILDLYLSAFHAKSISLQRLNLKERLK